MPDQDRPAPDPGTPEPIETVLRRALQARADSVEPKETNVSNIEDRADDVRRRNQRRRGWLAAAAVVAIVAGIAGIVALNGDDDEDVVTEPPASTTSTTEQTTTTSTTSTTAPPVDDDGVLGWPGQTARVFDAPEAAALAFASDVLGFAEPTLAEGTTEGDDGRYVIYPRPSAGVPTMVDVHFTGPIRGWVVTGAESSQGTIDDAELGTDSFTLSGSATAFEATVTVLVLDMEGNVLAETFTNAGANGEMGPYTAEIEVDPSAGTPFWIMIAESDASGEGTYTWATTYDLFAGEPG
jgi:hypothetical protein